jgi:hypothetical protein
MRKYYTLFALIALFITQQSFADMTDTDNMSTKECKVIAKSCLKAGCKGKDFWFDCMKPVLLGKTVAKVTVDANDVSACRQAKITKMQTELEQLQQVK